MVDVYFLRTESIDFVHYSSDELGVFLNKKMIFEKQKKNVSRIRKKTFYLQFCMAFGSTKKVCFLIKTNA
jgi:hypothetical protein